MDGMVGWVDTLPAIRGAPRVSRPNTPITASALATSILPRPQVDDSFRRPSILQVFDLPAFKTSTTANFDDKLPSIGHDRSRPSSSSTVASYTQQRHGSNASIQLPSLATLASAASNCPAANMNSNDNNDNMRRDTPEKRMPSPPSHPAKTAQPPPPLFGAATNLALFSAMPVVSS